MGIEVYANNMSIACKEADGKTIAAFPDVCFTPPLTPATPPGVPIPYPNTAMASDTTDGTKTVMINGKEVMLKNISVFKKSTGDEAGSAPKKGVVTSTHRGEANFISWSMDVKFEGENVPRHLDMMGHNEQCFPTNTSPWPYLDKMALAPGGPCAGVNKKFKLVPYKNEDDEYSCKPDTGHHIIPGRCMKTRTTSASGSKLAEPAYPEGCSHDKAPVVCVDNENQHDGTHRDCHAIFDPIELAEGQRTGGTMSYAKASDAAAKSTAGINNGKEPSQKQQDCIKLQLDNYYKNCLKNKDGSVKKSAQLNASTEAHGGLVLPKLSSVGAAG